MKVYTKTGDSGSTSLVGGKRVSKNDTRVEAYGTVDELISHLGLLRAELPKEYDPTLRRIQEALMLGSAHLASYEPSPKVKSFPKEEIAFLEEKIDELSAKLPPQKAFILPSAPKEASLCHIARSVCRRAERDAVGIEKRWEDIDLTIVYLNRLSDYLFSLGRMMCNLFSVSEDFWLQ